MKCGRFPHPQIRGVRIKSNFTSNICRYFYLLLLLSITLVPVVSSNAESNTSSLTLSGRVVDSITGNGLGSVDIEGTVILGKDYVVGLLFGAVTDSYGLFKTTISLSFLDTVCIIRVIAKFTKPGYFDKAVTLDCLIPEGCECGHSKNFDLGNITLSPEPTETNDQGGSVLPRGFCLEQNYPNPFNPTTTIDFAIPKKSFVNITIFDLLGNKVTTLVERELSSSNYRVSWDGKKSDGQLAPTGIYLYRIQAGEFTETRKMLLLK